jgi:hypothetical protein
MASVLSLQNQADERGDFSISERWEKSPFSQFSQNVKSLVLAFMKISAIILAIHNP